MDRQTIWIIVGISLALLFVLLFVIARRQGYTLALPGMPAMPNMVGWAHLSPILLKLSLPPLIVYGLIWLVQATYPEQFQNYLERGGPSYSLIAFTLLLVMASFIPSEGLKKVAVTIMVFIFGLPFVWALLGTMFFGKPSPPGTPRATQSVQKTDECPGVPETLGLASGQRRTINPRACQLRWKIQSGCVQALNAQGDVLYAKACAGGDEAKVPPGLHTVVALGPAEVRWTECGRHATGNYLDSCE